MLVLLEYDDQCETDKDVLVESVERRRKNNKVLQADSINIRSQEREIPFLSYYVVWSLMKSFHPHRKPNYKLIFSRQWLNSPRVCKISWPRQFALSIVQGYMIWHFWKKDKSGLFKNKNIFSSWKSWYNPARWKTNFFLAH